MMSMYHYLFLGDDQMDNPLVCDLDTFDHEFHNNWKHHYKHQPNLDQSKIGEKYNLKSVQS